MGYSGFSWDLCGLPFFSFFFLFKVLTAAFLVKERRRNFPVPYRVDCSYLYLFLLCVYIFICVTVGKAGGNCCGWDTARRGEILYLYIYFFFFATKSCVGRDLKIRVNSTVTLNRTTRRFVIACRLVTPRRVSFFVALRKGFVSVVLMYSDS